jgi:hypothetical protein
MKQIPTPDFPSAFALAALIATMPLVSVRADAGHSHGAKPAANHAHGGDNGSFSSVGQALKVVATSIESSSKAVTAGDLKPIHEATEQMDGAIKYLLTSGSISDNDKKIRAEAALKQMLVLSGELHVAADAGDATKSGQTLKKLQGAMKLVEIQYPPEATAAPSGVKSMSGMDHGDSHPASATVATTKVSVTTTEPLTVGKEATATVKLTKPDGSPMLLSDLKEAHTEKIHLLINDTSLSDYHHEHPVATATPGEYTFNFTPSKPGPYRVWADLVPVATDAQEYAIANIAASTKGEPLTNRTMSTTSEVDGLKYAVTFESPLKSGKAVLGKLTITKPDGSPFNELEPVMGAYSHIVGFSEDFQTIAHIHPMGAEPTKLTDRGAGELEFHLLPAKPGLMRLYSQIRVNGEDKFAPFTLEIQP